MFPPFDVQLHALLAQFPYRLVLQGHVKVAGHTAKTIISETRGVDLWIAYRRLA